MSEEQAAEKIQASFRGYKTRKVLKDNGVMPASKIDANKKSNGEVDEKTGETPEHPEEKIAKPGSALSTDPDEIVDIDLNDAELARAAAKIQASYRNFSAKKKQVETTDSKEPPDSIKEEQTNNEKDDEENLDDIDLEDPQVEKAALKIQSTFRGYKVRREILPENTPMANGEKGEDEE